MLEALPVFIAVAWGTSKLSSHTKARKKLSSLRTFSAHITLDGLIVRWWVNLHDFRLMPTAGGPSLPLGLMLSCLLMPMIAMATLHLGFAAIAGEMSPAAAAQRPYG